MARLVQLLPLRRFQGIDGNEILQELHLRGSMATVHGGLDAA